MNWIFKVGDNLEFDKDSQIGILTLEQKRFFSGKGGEDVLILEKTHSEWKFSAHYKIELVDVQNPEAELKTIKIQIALVEKFKDDKLLDDYIYSLLRVTNYINPIKHFSRKYIRLFDAEYGAIVENKVYTKRSIFGTVVNAMHLDHRKSFISYIALENPKLMLGGADMDQALSLLTKYLDFAVIQPSLHLREAVEMLSSIIPKDMIQEIGFGISPESVSRKDVQLLGIQAELVNEFVHLLNLENEEIYPNIIKGPSDWKFKSLFKNSPLPITLS